MSDIITPETVKVVNARLDAIVKDYQFLAMRIHEMSFDPTVSSQEVARSLVVASECLDLVPALRIAVNSATTDRDMLNLVTGVLSQAFTRNQKDFVLEITNLI